MNDVTSIVPVAPAASTIVVASLSDQLRVRVVDALTLADSYRNSVTCHELREALSSDIKSQKDLLAEIETERTKITKPLNESLHNTNEFFKKLSAPVRTALGAMVDEANRWDREQQRIAQEAARVASAAADAERKRLADLAAASQAAGQLETAHTIREAAQLVQAIPLPAPPKIAGEIKRKQWSAELHDVVDEKTGEVTPALVALARAIGEGKASHALIQLDEPAANAIARSLKGALNIPGLRAVCKDIIANR